MIGAFGGNAGWDEYYGGPNDSGTGLFVNNTDQAVKNDGKLSTVGSPLTKNKSIFFSDYHSIHNWSGVASPAYVFNGSWIASNIVGMYASDIYSYGDGSTSDYTVCSRLS